MGGLVDCNNKEVAIRKKSRSLNLRFDMVYWPFADGDNQSYSELLEPPEKNFFFEHEYTINLFHFQLQYGYDILPSILKLVVLLSILL